MESNAGNFSSINLKVVVPDGEDPLCDNNADSAYLNTIYMVTFTLRSCDQNSSDLLSASTFISFISLLISIWAVQ